ncbi:MAG: ABC transporter permease [Dehalococcoidia bacterium]|nr:ABC transporter permease [Dehalococcoidia bacterium]
MTPRNVRATSVRVLRQLEHDPRTVALLIVVPVVLMFLVRWVYWSQEPIFQRIGVPLLGIFPMTSMFLVTSITMLRERTTGTLERLLTMPMGKLDLLLGYALAFALLAVAQGVIVSVVAFGVLGLDVEGARWGVIALAVLNAVLGTAMGLFVSAFATTEFQAVQFMPMFLLPQMLLCGLLAPRDQMFRGLELLSDILPMTYAYDALVRVARGDGLTGGLFADIVILAGMAFLSLALGAVTLRRRTL